MNNRQVINFTAPYALEVGEEQRPYPQAGELLVQTLFSAISSGTEMLVYRGQMPDDIAVDATIEGLAKPFSYPIKYGYAAVGQVIACGAGVDKQWHDRIVFAFQPHVSHFVTQPEQVLALPEGISPDTALFLPNMETAVSFLMDSQPMIGEQVAVFGQGVVGLLTTALLADLPLASLVTLDRYALRRQWSLRLGADAALDPTDTDVNSQLQLLLQGQRPYGGADLTFELSGNPAVLDQAIAVTGYDGRLLIGSWYGSKQAPLNLGGHFHRSHMRLISSQVSHIKPQWNGRFSKARRLGVAWKMLMRHNPQRLITHRFPITRAAEAYRLLDRESETAVQIILTYV